MSELIVSPWWWAYSHIECRTEFKNPEHPLLFCGAAGSLPKNNKWMDNKEEEKVAGTVQVPAATALLHCLPILNTRVPTQKSHLLGPDAKPCGVNSSYQALLPYLVEYFLHLLLFQQTSWVPPVLCQSSCKLGM